jgi:hypothetical protein
LFASFKGIREPGEQEGQREVEKRKQTPSPRVKGLLLSHKNRNARQAGGPLSYVSPANYADKYLERNAQARKIVMDSAAEHRFAIIASVDIRQPLFNPIGRCGFEGARLQPRRKSLKT